MPRPISPDRLVDKLRRELRQMLKRTMRDPEYAAWQMKWFYEHPLEWARISGVGRLASERPAAGPEKGACRKIPPRERAAACQRAVLDYLVSLPMFAFSARNIARHVNEDEPLRQRHHPGGPDWTEREIGRAADALVARGLVRFNFNWFCDRKYYQATGEGARTALPQPKGGQ